MDLNELLHRHQLSLMQIDKAESSDERRAHSQFACDFANRIQTARDKLGAPAQRPAPAGSSVRHETSSAKIGPTVCVTSRVMLVPSEQGGYAVVICHDGDESTRHSFRTMREAEAFVRLATPAPAPRSTLYDRKSDQV